MVKKLLKYTKGCRHYTILTPLCVVVEVLCEVFIPFLMIEILDFGLNQEIGINMDIVLKNGIIMVILALIALLFGALSGRFAALASSQFASNIREALYTNIQEFSFSNLDKFQTSSLVTRLTTDVSYVQQAFQMTIRILFRSPVMLISSLVIALNINAPLSLVFVAAIPFLSIALFLIFKFAFRHFIRMFKKIDEVNQVTQENLSGIRTVKSFVRENYEIDKFNKANSDLNMTAMKAEKIIILMNPAMQFVIFTCILMISWFGTFLVKDSMLTSAELLILINYVNQILFSLSMIAMVISMIVMSEASAKRIIEVLDEKSSIINGDNPLFRVQDGSVVFKDVTFKYKSDNENAALKTTNLTINSGEVVGIIGGTGSSKSTLIQLIPRLYDASSGSVLVGGEDVRKYDLKTLRDSVSFVLQKNILFSGTIKDNLKWGNQEATDEEIMKVAKITAIHDFIMGLEGGYDYHVEQGGVNFSGGQKQRLCIARALLKNPKILILDDSTSAIDTKTDADIRKALKEEISGVTKIIVAQRVDSIKGADKIVVLDAGTIVAIGTHDELLKTNEIYNDVYTTQHQNGGEIGA